MKLNAIQSQDEILQQLRELLQATKESAESELNGLVQSPDAVMALVQQNLISDEFVLDNKQFWVNMFAQWAANVDPKDLQRIYFKIATDIKNKLDIAEEAGIVLEFVGPKGKELIGKIGAGVGNFLRRLKELAVKAFKAIEINHGGRGYGGYGGRYSGYGRNRSSSSSSNRKFKRSRLNPYIIYTFIEQAKELASKNAQQRQAEQTEPEAVAAEPNQPDQVQSNIDSPSVEML